MERRIVQGCLMFSAGESQMTSGEGTVNQNVNIAIWSIRTLLFLPKKWQEIMLLFCSANV